MKKLSDYIHLYIGCDVLTYGSNVEKLDGIGHNDGKTFTNLLVHTSDAFTSDRCHIENVKLLLRPLSDMTEDEKDGLRHADRIATSQNILPEIRASRLTNYHFTRKSAEITRYLLSRGFDLFGLIDAGLAIDKTKTKATTRITE